MNNKFKIAVLAITAVVAMSQVHLFLCALSRVAAMLRRLGMDAYVS